MKLPIPLLLALACMAGGVAAQTAPRAASPSAKPVEIDRVVAVVNTDVITMLELETRRLSVERQTRDIARSSGDSGYSSTSSHSG